MLHLLWIIPLVLLIIFFSSPRFRGDIAETRVRRLLQTGLERSRYTVFHGLIIPSGGGTRRIPHLVVSRMGVFVIDSCYTPGGVSGTDVQARWKRRGIWGTRLFDNPVHRNALQLDAVQRILDYPRPVFHPIVVLVGHRGFRKRPPVNVMGPESLLLFMRKKTHHLLTSEQADRAVHRLQEKEVRPRGGLLLRPVSLLRLLLLVALLAGLYFAFGDELAEQVDEYRLRSEQRARPELYHPDGSPKTEREVWEDSLICAYSADTGRCSCYDRDGSRVDMEPAVCRSLAERGSVLKQ